MKLFAAALALILFPGATMRAQSPSDGHLENGRYVSTFFHLVYTWPRELVPVDPGTLRLNVPANDHEFLLFVARQAGQPYGIVTIAERLSPKGIVDGPDFIRRIVAGNRDQPYKELRRTHLTNAFGIAFDLLDYKIGDEFDSGIVTRQGQYLMVFKANAGSAAELAGMTTSILAMKPQNSF